MNIKRTAKKAPIMMRIFNFTREGIATTFEAPTKIRPAKTGAKTEIRIMLRSNLPKPCNGGMK